LSAMISIGVIKLGRILVVVGVIPIFVGIKSCPLRLLMTGGSVPSKYPIACEAANSDNNTETAIITDKTLFFISNTSILKFIWRKSVKVLIKHAQIS